MEQGGGWITVIAEKIFAAVLNRLGSCEACVRKAQDVEDAIAEL